MTYQCTVKGCDGEKTEPIPMLEHSWNDENVCTECGAEKPSDDTADGTKDSANAENNAIGALIRRDLLPKTGDDSHMILWAGIALLMGILAVVIGRIRQGKRT